MTITFAGRVRKSGNSLVVTIPNGTRNIYGIKEGEAVQITLLKLDEHDLLKED